MSKEIPELEVINFNRNNALMMMYSTHHLESVGKDVSFKIHFINPNDHLPGWSTNEPFSALNIRRNNVRNLTLETDNQGKVTLHLNTPFHGGIGYDINIPGEDIFTIEALRWDPNTSDVIRDIIFHDATALKLEYPAELRNKPDRLSVVKDTVDNNVVKVDFTKG